MSDSFDPMNYFSCAVEQFPLEELNAFLPHGRVLPTELGKGLWEIRA